ncbi:MAG: hypothetical protein JNL26_19385 [Gemmatimonadetes bacterium]|nr:hypothetical protein [Gemmatimonadota bacterium]
MPAPVVPAPAPPPPVETPATPAPFVVPAPSVAALQLDVRTLVVSADSARRDSTNLSAITALAYDARGLNVRVVRNDSAGRLDSLPPIMVDRSGRWNAARITLPCRDLGLLPSPLVVRLVQPRASRDWPVQDSLSYTMCSRGSPRTVTAVVSWQAPVPTADRASYEQMVQVAARIVGDSTRAFPMRTTGTMRGEARLRVTGGDGRLLGSQGSLTVELTATANALRQRASQVVSFVATPLP